MSDRRKPSRTAISLSAFAAGVAPLSATATTSHAPAGTRIWLSPVAATRALANREF